VFKEMGKLAEYLDSTRESPVGVRIVKAGISFEDARELLEGLQCESVEDAWWARDAQVMLGACRDTPSILVW
jgi:hypothetical protein